MFELWLQHTVEGYFYLGNVFCHGSAKGGDCKDQVSDSFVLAIAFDKTHIYIEL